MINNIIKRFMAGIGAALLLLSPATAFASVNPDATSAATAGIQYLANNQNADGSISGFGGESDWSTEAIVAAGQTPDGFAHNGSASLLSFLQGDVPGASTSATAIERKIIAIAAAGQDPTNFGGVDYMSLLADQSNNDQIGDTTLLNDDIFGIIAIDAAHDTDLLPEAQNALDYLIANQGVGGDTGFGYSNDCSSWCASDSSDTAAAIIAMYAATDLGLTNPGLADAQSGALSYLLSTQASSGGFEGDVYSDPDGGSTAWALMALNMIGSSVSTEATQAVSWLLDNQNADGGFSYGAYGYNDSDTYTTAHAVIALLGSTWLLKPTPTVIPAPTGGQGGETPVTTPTVTEPTVTTTTTTSAAAPKPQSDTPDTTPITDTSTATPQVEGAATVKQLLTVPDSKAATTLAKPSHHSATVWIILGLILVAVLWFVVESRQTGKGDNDAK